MIGSSTANGDAQPPAGDIDTTGSRSWALRAVSFTPPIIAVRPLTGPLSPGQQISFDIDGICTSPNSQFMDVFLGNASGNRWRVDIRPTAIGFGSDGSDGSPEPLIISGTPEGVHIDFTLTGADTYELSVNVLGAQPTVVTGTLGGTSGSPIDQVSLGIYPSFFPNDVFYSNSLAVTPEPSSGLILMCVAAKIISRGRQR
jgi:hypothetical protein